MTHNEFPLNVRRLAVKCLNLLTGYLRPNALPEADKTMTTVVTKISAISEQMLNLFLL